MDEKQDTRRILNELQSKSSGKRREITIIIVLSLMIVIVFLGIASYFYFKSPERVLGLGADIEGLVISEDGLTAFVRMSGGSLDKNITKIKFIFTDDNGDEYYYDTEQGIVEMEMPYKKSFWDWLLGRQFIGNYNYEISLDDIEGIEDFNILHHVGVVFEYEEDGVVVDSPVLDTELPAPEVFSSPSPSSNGPSSGPGPSGGDPQPSCGDGTCDAGEDCSSCSSDCGECVVLYNNSITQFNITWTFDKEYEYGQFANGDYWVVPDEVGGNVTIVGISPSSVDLTQTRAKNAANDCREYDVSCNTGNCEYTKPLISFYPSEVYVIVPDTYIDNSQSCSVADLINCTDNVFSFYRYTNDSTTCYYNRIRHGSMINPSPVLDDVTGYDSAIGIGTYDPNLNVAFDVDVGDPLVVEPDSSLLSTISMEEGGTTLALKTAAILTILDSVPLGGSFRPAYTNISKEIKFNKNQLDYSLLGNLEPVANMPILHKDILDDPNDQDETVERMFERPWIEYVPDWPGRFFHPEENMPHNGVDVAAQGGIGALMLNLNYTNEEKENLTIRMVQLGIDNYGVILDGGKENWAESGGHTSGRKWPILFAGLILNDFNMTNIGEKSGDYLYSGDFPVSVPSDYIHFAEDDQTFYVSNYDVFPQPYDLNMHYSFEYKTGNVNVTNGDFIVEGVGTSWLSIDDSKTLFFGVINDSEAYNPYGRGYRIQSINSDTNLTLESEYRGDTDTTGTAEYLIAEELFYGHGGGGAIKTYNNLSYDYIEYTSEDLGLPDWGIAHIELLIRDGKTWTALYRRCCNAIGWAGFILSAQVMEEKTNAKTLWNHNVLFDYQDRYMYIASEAGLGTGWRQNPLFVGNMWDTYRSQYGCVWTLNNNSDIYSNGYYDCGEQNIMCSWQNSVCSDCELVSSNCIGYDTQRSCEYDPCNLDCSWDGSSCVECAPFDTRSCDTIESGVCSEGTQTCQVDKNWGSCIANIQPEDQVEDCFDDADNDCDGEKDCDDDDCQVGTETDCDDGVDNDCDGSPDCSDSDCGGTSSCPSYLTGIISWWRFEGDANDIYGINDGTLVNNAVIVPDVERENVLSLEGFDDYVEIPLSQSLNNTNYTKMLWLKLNNIRNYDTFFRDYDAGSIYVDSAGSLRVYYTNAAGFSTNEIGSIDLISDVWYHVAIVRSVSDDDVAITYYVNGSLVDVVDVDTGGVTPSPLKYIGDNGANAVNGSIDEVMVFSRALNSTEIGEIYDAQLGGVVENVFLDPSNDFETEDITFIMESPNTGYDLTIRSVRPNLTKYPNKGFPAVLTIQGGWGLMNGFLSDPKVQPTASKGMFFVSFNSELRDANLYPIGSTERDYKGFKDQADVAAVLEYMIENKNVNPDNIGIWSASSGALMVAGVLGREDHKDLSEKIGFWMDAEGPHCVKDLIRDLSIDFENPTPGTIWAKWRAAVDAKVGSGLQYATEDEFWYERCGNNFIGNYTGIYQRLQGRNDHALGYYYNQTLAYLNTATNGNAAWTRLNDYPKDVIYTEQSIAAALDRERLSDDPNFVWERLYNLSRGGYEESVIPTLSPLIKIWNWMKGLIAGPTGNAILTGNVAGNGSREFEVSNIMLIGLVVFFLIIISVICIVKVKRRKNIRHEIDKLLKK